MRDFTHENRKLGLIFFETRHYFMKECKPQVFSFKKRSPFGKNLKRQAINVKMDTDTDMGKDLDMETYADMTIEMDNGPDI